MPHTNRKKPFPFFLWHRRLGLVGLLLIIILAITGIMLNHTEGLKLDESYIESDILLNWYELNPKGKLISYKAGNNTVSQWSNQLFFNHTTLIISEEKLRGAVTLQNMTVIALENTIILVDSTGELIEKLKDFTDIKNIRSIGLLNKKSSQQHVVIKTDKNQVFISDAQILTWKATQSTAVIWQSPIILSKNKIEQLKQSYRGHGLTLERIILDLHSGRIFNAQWGVYIMDANAIIMILLGFSGVWMWWSRNKKMETKQHYKKRHKAHNN